METGVITRSHAHMETAVGWSPPGVDIYPGDVSQLLRSHEQQFRGGLVFKARRRLYHSTLGREK